MLEGRAGSVAHEIGLHLRQGHAMMREVAAGLSPDALDWSPGPEMNSIAVLVAHALDAERHLTASVARIDLERDREAAFQVRGLTADELVSLIDAVERDVEAHLARITPDQLAAPLVRGERTHSGAGWLIAVVAHSREHAGQASLTRQLG